MHAENAVIHWCNEWILCWMQWMNITHILKWMQQMQSCANSMKDFMHTMKWVNEWNSYNTIITANAALL